jgi:pantoate--beta-alanine ligase
MAQVLHSINAARALRQTLTGRIGLVPTMGALHSGHLNLVKQAHMENDSVWVSVFVNPTQFGPNEDFNRYPRDLQGDTELIRKSLSPDAVNKTFVFAPSSPSEVYLPNASTFVNIEGIDESKFAEGSSRPGHFRGVCTVVAKLFGIIQPTNAYFGAKDGLQAIVLRKMTRELNIPVNVSILETVREADGLALSSRNRYLSEEDRRHASAVPASLFAVEKAYTNSTKERNVGKLKKSARDVLDREEYLKVQYVSLADATTGFELDDATTLAEGQVVMVSLAVRCGTTRLIDNILLPSPTYPFRSPMH